MPGATDCGAKLPRTSLQEPVIPDRRLSHNRTSAAGGKGRLDPHEAEEVSDDRVAAVVVAAVVRDILDTAAVTGAVVARTAITIAVVAAVILGIGNE